MCPFARWGEQVVAFFSNKPRDAWRFIVVFLNCCSEGLEGGLSIEFSHDGADMRVTWCFWGVGR